MAVKRKIEDIHLGILGDLYSILASWGIYIASWHPGDLYSILASWGSI
jgi:hypothetical protein